MSITRPPKAVTFDCWSTLISDTNWEKVMQRRREALVEIARRNGVELTSEGAEALIDAAWQQHMAAWRRGKIYGARGAASWILGELNLPAFSQSNRDGSAQEELEAELAYAIESATSTVGTYVLDGAVDALEAVSSAGIATAWVCDTGFTPARFVRQFLDEHGLKLDHYFFSDEVGAPKPHPPIFQAALAATGAKPEEAVHIGDLRRTDMAGARSAGMGSIRYVGVHDDAWPPEDSSGEEADAVIEHWSELAPLLGI